MRVMVIVKATKESEAGVLPSQQLLTDMGRFNEQLAEAGLLVTGDGLHPSSRGVRVRFSGKSRIVTDGPFSETRELIAGFWIWRVKSMEEAIEWVKRCPNPMNEDSDIEIRPLYEAEEFGEAMSPELREQEAGWRAAGLGLGTPEFREGGELEIVGLNQTYSDATRGEIPRQWERFAPSLGKVPGQRGTTAYGVCWNCQPDGRFDYLTGVEASSNKDVPAGFTSLRIAPRRYAVFAHEGHVSEIDRVLGTIDTQWRPDCGLQLAKAPMIECYTPRFNSATLSGGIELWIPLER